VGDARRVGRFQLWPLQLEHLRLRADTLRVTERAAAPVCDAAAAAYDSAANT
jgi:hypothetical protein